MALAEGIKNNEVVVSARLWLWSQEYVHVLPIHVLPVLSLHAEK